MPVFDFRFTVPASLDAVRAFHGDTSALRTLTPPPTIVQLHAVEPLAEGSVSRFTLWLGPVPIAWTAVHRNVSGTGFTDVQASGPVAKWEHTHTFVPLAENLTEVREHIEFEHFSGLRGLFTRVLFARPNLLAMFTYRRWITRRRLRQTTQSA